MFQQKWVKGFQAGKYVELGRLMKSNATTGLSVWEKLQNTRVLIRHGKSKSVFGLLDELSSKQLSNQERLATISLILEASNHFEQTESGDLRFYNKWGIKVLESMAMGDQDNYLLEGIFKREVGKYWLRLGNTDLAREQLDIASEIFDQLGDVFEQSECKKALGELELHLGRFKHAIKILEESISLRHQLRNEYDLARSLNRLGAIYFRKGDLKRSYGLFEKARSLLMETIYHKELANILNNLAIINHQRSRLNKAYNFAILSLQEAMLMNYENEVARVHNTLGMILSDMGKLGKAKDYLTLALRYQKRQQNELPQARILTNLANIYFREGRVDDALEIYFQTYKIKVELRENASLVINCHNIGEVYLKKGNLDLAEQYLAEAFDLAGSQENRLYMAKIRSSRSKLLLFRGDFDQAEEELSASAELWNALDNKIELTDTMIKSAALKKYAGDLKAAHNHLTKALKYADHVDDKLIISDILFQLSELAYEMDDQKKLKKYLKRLTKLDNVYHNKYIKVRTLLVDILYLNKNPRFKTLSKTRVLLDQLFSEELDDFDLYISTMLCLCNYLLMEFKLSNDTQILDDLINQISDLYEIAEVQPNYHLLVEIVLIQARVAVIENNYSIATFFIQEAMEIVSIRGLDHIGIRVAAFKVELEFRQSLLQLQFETQSDNQRTLLIDQLIAPQSNVVTGPNEDLIESLIHDINNYLMGVKGFSQLFETELYSPSLLKEMAGSIEMSTEQIQKLISIVIEEKTVRDQPTELQLVSIDPSELLKSRQDLFVSQVYHKQLKFSITPSKEPVWIVAEESHFLRVVDNLLHNAVKFTPQGGRVQLRIYDRGDEVIIEIENEGPSIPLEYQEIIFEKYVKISGLNGFGIGLAFCKEAMHQMNGKIKLISPLPGEEHGARFVLSFKKAKT
ncbi:MAG: tetratricopeptide repeat protein [Candidatus Heimdallarchaeota archaeon]|nr:tetratricopeptide repeat protein [Candidatus Heimdallarchaeota archaeon]